MSATLRRQWPSVLLHSAIGLGQGVVVNELPGY
jgi:hypothetical protein